MAGLSGEKLSTHAMARELGKPLGTVSSATRRLRRKGLVRKPTFGPQPVKLTAEGRKMAAAANERIRRSIEAAEAHEVLCGLRDNELDTLMFMYSLGGRAVSSQVSSVFNLTPGSAYNRVMFLRRKGLLLPTGKSHNGIIEMSELGHATARRLLDSRS